MADVMVQAGAEVSENLFDAILTLCAAMRREYGIDYAFTLIAKGKVVAAHGMTAVVVPALKQGGKLEVLAMATNKKIEQWKAEGADWFGDHVLAEGRIPAKGTGSSRLREEMEGAARDIGGDLGADWVFEGMLEAAAKAGYML